MKIRPERAGLILELIAVFYSLLSLAMELVKYLTQNEKALRWIPLLDVDHELSLPTIYSVQLLFVLVILLVIISKIKHNQKDQFRYYWTILSFGFFLMTLDEGASIHELIVMPIRNWIGEKLPGFLLFNWVIPGMLLVGILIFILWKFFQSLPQRTKKYCFISAVVYLFGALGMEMVGGYYADLYGIKNLTYNIIVTVEEFLEMSGLVTFIYTLLDYVVSIYTTIEFRISSNE